MYRKSYVEINLDNICFNIKNIIKKYNNYKYYIAIVKGNVYGHGEYSLKYMIDSGINYLATSSLEEALSIRKIIKNIPILILEPIHINEIDIAIKNNITITLSSYEYYKNLKKLNIEGLKVHLKLNTGMNRLGINSKKEVKEIIENLSNNIEGIYSHLATTGIIDEYYDKQINKFNYLTSELDLSKIKMIHLFRSTSLELHPKVECCNGVRLGIIMYGYGQTFIAKDTLKQKLRNIKYNYIKKIKNISYTYNSNDLQLKPAFKLKSEIIQINKIQKDDIVGYAGVYKAMKEEYIAVCPIGYADGITNGYKDKNVSINGKIYKIVGLISMGMITIKVDNKVKVGDIVTIIGDEVGVKDTAVNTGLSPHQTITNINKNIPRVYIKNDKIINITEY